MFFCPMHSVKMSACGGDEVRMRRSNAADLFVVDLQHAVVGEESVHLGLDVAHLQGMRISHIVKFACATWVAQAMLF